MKNQPFQLHPAAMFVAIALTLVGVVASRPASALADETAVTAPELPGVWCELEAGGWHTNAKSSSGASGGKRVSWFDQKGRAVYVEFTLEKPMPSAIVYLRYSGGSNKPIDLSLAPITPEGKVVEARPLGQMILKATGNADRYAWAQLPIGDLPAGKHRLIYALSVPGGADLDVTGIAADEHNGLWTPPDQVINGKLVGVGSVAVALLSVKPPAQANLLGVDEVTGPAAKPVSFALTLRNQNLKEPAKLDLRGTLTDAAGKATELAMVTKEIAPGTTDKVMYDVQLPGEGQFTLDLRIEGDAGTKVSIPYRTTLRVLPVTPIWVEGERCQGVGTGGALNSGRAAGGSYLFYGWEPKAGATVSFAFELTKDMPQTMLYFRYSRPAYRDWAGAAPTDIHLGPATATKFDDPGVKRIAPTQMELTKDAMAWQSVALGALPAGKHRVFLVSPRAFGGGNLDILGILPPIERGLWLPPNTVVDGRLAGEGSLRSGGIETLGALRGERPGNLLPGAMVLGPNAKPARFTATFVNRLATEPVTCQLVTELSSDVGVVGTPVNQALTLGPGETRELPLDIRVPDYGWYNLRVTPQGSAEAKPLDAMFAVLRAPAQGVRPDSMFGINIFDSGPDDLELAQMLGVKWRRGVPGVKPDVVNPASGKFWDDAGIQKARQTVENWKQHDILCMGTIDYNMSWNVQPDPLGRKMQTHENRPKDLAAQAEMVYQTIKPMVDLVPHWELWNEPWIHEWTWRSGTAQDYRDMTRLIWERVKPEFPQAQLIAGGSTSFQRDVLFAQGSKDAGYADGVTAHMYGIPEGTSVAYAALDAAMLQRYAKDGGKASIWSTELGTSEFVHYKDVPPSEGRLLVARSLTPLFALNRLGAGTTPIRLFWFAWGYKQGFSGDFLNVWQWDQPKPVVAAYSAAAHFLEDGRVTGDLYPQSSSLWGVHFAKPDGSSVVALWSEQDHRGQIVLPAEGFTAYDYMGRAIGETRDGKLTLPLVPWETRFLVSSRHETEVKRAFAQATFPGMTALQVNPRSFTAPLDRRPALRVKVRNVLPVTLDATLDVVPPAGFTLATTQAQIKALAPGEARIVEFALTSASPNTVNRYPIDYRAQANGVTQNGTQVVQVACATYAPSERTPKIDGDLAEWSGIVPVTLLSRGGKDTARILMDPNLTADLIAGKLSGDVAVYRLWTLWDAEHLYVAAEVPDAKLTTNSTFADDPYAFPFLADCLQLAFDCVARNPDDLLAGSPLYDKALASDVDYEFAATLARQTNDGPGFATKPAWKGDLGKAPRVPQLHRLRAPGTDSQTFYPTNAPTQPPLGAMGATAAGGEDGSVAIIYDDAKKVFRYEIAIPWKNIRELGEQAKALREGEAAITRFAFSINDPGGRWRNFWTVEAGDAESGAYGFSPSWEGGRRAYGGRIQTDWGIVR